MERVTLSVRPGEASTLEEAARIDGLSCGCIVLGVVRLGGLRAAGLGIEGSSRVWGHKAMDGKGMDGKGAQVVAGRVQRGLLVLPLGGGGLSQLERHAGRR